MEKELCCKDVGSDCDYVICGSTEDEIFQKAAEHAKAEHNLSDIPADLRERARSAIRDVEKCSL